MRLITWNICFGGIGAGRNEYDPVRSEENLRRIADAILKKDPDIVVLAEYRDARKTGGLIKSLLLNAGYETYCSNSGLDKNGILIALGSRITRSYQASVVKHFPVSEKRLDEIYRYRWLNLSLNSNECSFELLGLHLPDVRRGRSGGPEAFVRSLGYKQLIWDAVIEYAREMLNTGKDTIITGDFNTGLNDVDQSPDSGTYYLSDRMEALKGLKNQVGRGLTDAWRKFHLDPGPEDYSWFTGDTGYRLDYVFLTPRLAEGLTKVEYSHTERINGLSDHSLLISDINL